MLINVEVAFSFLNRHSLPILSYAPFADYAEEEEKPTFISSTNFDLSRL
jgi:hypothetical protein